MIRNRLFESLKARQLEMPEPEPEYVPEPIETLPKPKPRVKEPDPELIPDDMENLTLDECVSLIEQEQEFHDHSDLLEILDELLAKSSEKWGSFIINDWDTSNLEEIRNGLLLCRSMLAQDPKVKLDD